MKSQSLPTPTPKAAPEPPSDAADYRWVLLAEHCRRTGETSQMVHTRRKRGIWLDGKHTKLASKKRLYVNIEEYNRWVESQKH
ncbi:hypothetical protein AVME950_02545 [Acidovorax sp. SUPP950]|uniref:hypothetical protein n=1 Tax=Acidovorax sp. SUPP950 TaxID=511901 RepID=UPI0023C8D855|nr:hypothetical protein [Acidovorax sp. SUPP950]GKS73727.1 hypothetical protein AVME950_02545 [Acidovorax sp. SUPP950]